MQKESLLDLRQKIRNNLYQGATSGLALGNLQANLVILDKDWANDFLLFCQRNSVACPLLGVANPGETSIEEIGSAVDISTDAPEYYIFRNGELESTVPDLSNCWQKNWVSFALGCSFSFEQALEQAGLGIRNLEQNVNVSMYNTNIPCRPAGRFAGNLVVSMRPFTPKEAIAAIQITSRFPKAHGAPIHFGDPRTIGIEQINQPDYGDPVLIKPGEIPVFWACGVTPQNAIKQSKPPICVTHSPGKMLITDRQNTDN